MSDERREFQRLKLAKPILATMDEGNALVLDIGVAGALLEHYGEVTPGDRFRLTFRWMGEDVSFVCSVVRTTPVRQGGDRASLVSHTGARFLEPFGDSALRLQDLMATFVGRVLAAQRANAAGENAESAATLASLGAARRRRTHGFLSFRLRDNKWWRVPTDTHIQPPDGFTVPAWEDDSELETLCRTYETADEAGRNLIRLIAELSVAQARLPE